MQDYTPKNLVFGEQGREKLINGIRKLSEAVKSTLGPSGRTVLIESQTHTSGMTVTKDGVTVARSVDLIDPVENLAVRVMKQAAEKTATNAGDGTTTAIVLTEAIIMSVIDQLGDQSESVNMVEVTRELEEISKDVISKIKELSEELTNQRLLDVATISSNNDKNLGKLIADTYANVDGEQGIVLVDRSKSGSTYSDVIKGILIDKGYSSPLFINDHRRDECILDNPYVLVCDSEISNIFQLTKILGWILKEGKRLVIIAPCSTAFVNTLASNKIKQGMNVCVVQPPTAGYRQHELMQDIAVSVGAKYFSEKTGDDLSLITIEDLGRATKMIASKDKTTIIREELHEETEKRIAELKVQHEETDNKIEKDHILQRIASLSGGIGVIYVGGATDMEQKEKFDRVDDAVCAVRAAMSDGIVAGGGVTLAKIAIESVGDSIAANAMREALLTPMRQIYTNAGLSAAEFYKNRDESLSGKGLNLKTNEVGGMISMGVIDPSKVTQEAVTNAVSVATTILSTNAIVTLARSYEEQS
jgi:chaperonin GroEL